MVNNQEWFNKEYPKANKKIKFTDEDFQGQLVIENYPEVEKLYLQNVESINKITLKNSLQLQECTIWGCGLQELVIENCSQLKKLNVRNNSLTNLEFLANLESLEKLEIDYNKEINSGLECLPKNLKEFSYEGTKLTEILKPYQGDWKAYRIVELAKKRPRELLETISNLREQNKRLKKEVEEHNIFPQPMITDIIDFKEKYQGLKETLNSLLQEERKKTGEINPLKEASIDDVIVTEELIEKLQKRQSLLTDQEQQINYLEIRVQELINLIKQQKEKIINAFLRLFPEKELLQRLIIAHLELTRSKKQELPSIKLRRLRDKLQDELEEKLGDNEELAEKVQLILKDCEDLVTWELELEARLNNKSLLIENQKQRLQITDSSEEKIKLEEHEATQQKQTQQAQWVINQLRKQLKAKNQQVSAVLECQVVEKKEQLNNLLAAVTLVPSAQEKISVVQEEIRVLQEELEKVRGKEQIPQILQSTSLPYGTPGSSK